MKHLKTLTYIVDVSKTGSIRKTAEKLNITPSALTRKIQDFEYEIGTPIFERLPQGVRLNAAGELLVRYVRSQISDFERLRSQIADLAGARRGQISIACSQAFVDHVLPQEIEKYRSQFPLVSFVVQVRDHTQAITALTEHEADLALVIQPPPAPEMQTLLACSQPLCALMSRDHVLAQQEGPVRLRDCLQFPLALPDHSLAIRHMLNAALARMLMQLHVMVESGSMEFLRNYVLREPVVSFQVLSGIPVDHEGLIARPVDEKDLSPVQIILGQLRGRMLPVAAAKFADQISVSLHNLQHRYS
jgi:DNA-binding transcriptional LysR family regulator